jgi:hypothetical protein
MTNAAVFARFGNSSNSILRFSNHRLLHMIRGPLATTAAVLAVAALLSTSANAAPAQGDIYVYRLVNGYNQETVGQVRYEVASVNANQMVFSVTSDKPSMGVERTEIYTQDGNWLRHTLDNHGIPVDYEFAAAYPAYVFPLDVGKSWSVRANAKIPGGYGDRSVRVDGEVLGKERIRVPAGEFDTVKIRRIVYPGDAGNFRTETRIVEIDWYAPTLGRTVRNETRSNWREQFSCRRGYCDVRGDWNVFELVEVHAAKF